MALNPLDFITPQGELDPAMFPDGYDLNARMQAIYDTATARVTLLGVPTERVEMVATQLIYHLGFKAAVIAQASEPARSKVGRVEDEFTTDQRQTFKDLSLVHLKRYQQLLRASGLVDAELSSHGSTSIVMEVVF